MQDIDKLKAYWTSWANGNANVVPKLIEMTPELKPMMITPQSRSRHAEGNVARHTIMTCEAVNHIVEAVPPAERKLLRYASLLHDAGKPYCLIEAAPGICSFPNLQKESFTLARILLERYTQLNFREREYVLALINNHYLPLWMVENGRPFKRLIKLSLECNLETIYNLVKANYMGRHAQNLREKFELLETFKMWCTNQNLWNSKQWEGLLQPGSYSRFGKNAQTVKNIIDWFYLNDEIVDYLDAQDWIINNEDWQWGTLIYTVGPSGSGKSTWLENNYEMIDVVSTDKIRQEITGDIADQSQNDLVFNIAHERLIEALSRGEKVIFDATNLQYEHRKVFINFARKLGAHLMCLMFTTPFETCLTRLQERKELPLSEEVLEEQYNSYDYVSVYEYDKMIYI